jgi:hypothetical protein
MIKTISRRALLAKAQLAAGLLMASGVPGLAAADEEIKEADKITQADAKYQSHPKDQQRCEICLQYLAPGSCKIVQGPINPKGWCQFFAAKENAR